MMKKLLAALHLIAISFNAVATQLSPSNFSADDFLYGFEDLSGQPATINDVSGPVPIEFGGMWQSYQVAPGYGVNAISGTRSASPEDILDVQTGFRKVPQMEFPQGISAVGFYVTDSGGDLVSLAAFGVGGNLIEELTLRGPYGGSDPVFMGLGANELIFRIGVRRFTDYTPAGTTFDFEIDDLRIANFYGAQPVTENGGTMTCSLLAMVSLLVASRTELKRSDF